MKKGTFKYLFSLFLVLFIFPTSPSKSQTVADTARKQALDPISLGEINYEIGKVEKTFKKLETGLKPDYRFTRIDSSFQDFKKFLLNEADDFKSFNPYNLSKFFLENAFRLWEGFNRKLNGWQTEINFHINSLQGNISTLDKTIASWQLTIQSREFENEPQELKDRMRSIISQAQDYRLKYQNVKWKYVILEDEIVEMQSFCDGIINEILILQENKRDSLFIATDKPMWRVAVTSSDITPLRAKLGKFKHENSKTFRNYFQTQHFESFWILMVLVISLFYILRHKYLKMDFDDRQPGHKNIIRIFRGFPLLTAFSLVLVLFHLLNPYYPLLFNHVLTLLLLISMRYILLNFIDREDKIFISKIILLLVINDFEILFWYFGNLARYYILLEAIAGLVIFYPYLKPLLSKQFKNLDHLKKGKLFLSVYAIVFYLAAFVSNFFGYLDLAVLFAKVSIHVPEFTIILYGIYKIVVALIMALISLGKRRESSIFTLYWDNIQKRAIQVSRILAIYYWFYSFAVSFEVSRVIFKSIGDFLMKERTIGTLQITFGSILGLILILIITFLITGLLKITIENILVKRTRLPRGVPAAISATIRYFLIVMGFLFALSAAGIELGKFSLLAGALGVGIGFGLQNVVNNFISGLILIYERPITVGDTIEVENLLGQVHRIGIRSSNVKTYDGAEVVVPNGNLISNQLINWTLSDNKRRIEIKVGVAYGSDPNVVLKLLEKVANDTEEVMTNPAPWALFEEFGDSSLNFRLLFWVPYDIGMSTKSKVAIGIYNIFKEHNIEIPFPQVDLHVKDKPKG